MESKGMFTVTDQHELLALHRALFEAQFTAAPLDRDVPGSPLLASLANRVLNALAEQDPRWIEWRAAAQHPNRVSIVRDRLRMLPGWCDMTRSDRETLVYNHFAPLIPDDELIRALTCDAA